MSYDVSLDRNSIKLVSFSGAENSSKSLTSSDSMPIFLSSCKSCMACGTFPAVRPNFAISNCLKTVDDPAEKHPLNKVFFEVS